MPCIAIALDTVVIDSTPFVRILPGDASICQGEAVSFTPNVLPSENTGLSWSLGDGTDDEGSRSATVSNCFDGPGLYDVVLTATYRPCADVADTVQLGVRPFPSITVAPDTSICPGGEPIQLSARVSGGEGISEATQVVWSTGDTASSILARHHGQYWARANYEGCSAVDTIEVRKDCYLDVPNVFTPNSDGINDYFWPRQLLSKSLMRFSMILYNRWGQRVWETRAIDGRGWDGKFNGEDQPTGVYIYLVEAEPANGFAEKYQGNVTLMH